MLEVLGSVLQELFALVPPVPLVSVSVLIATIINVLKKYTTLVKDGAAPNWNLALNFFFWSGLQVASRLGVQEEVARVLSWLSQAAPLIVALYAGTLGTRLAHLLGRRGELPAFGPR